MTPIKLAMAMIATKLKPTLNDSGAVPGAKNPRANMGVTKDNVYPEPVATARIKEDPMA